MIAAPQHRRAFAGETRGSIGAEAVIRKHRTFGWKYAALGSPEGRPGLAGFDPADHGKIIHGKTLRWQQQSQVFFTPVLLRAKRVAQRW